MVDYVKNLYEILEVSPSATEAEIKIAYKKLVRVYHPDINKSIDAEVKFKLLNNAYDILSDELKRKNYDTLLNSAPRKETPKADKNSIIKEVKITEIEAQEGGYRVVNILNTQKCPKCMGKKFINGVKCSFCLGEGQKKELKKIEIEIKKGTKDGEYIFIDKVNSSALYDKNLFLKIVIEKSRKPYYDGKSKIVSVEVPLYDAILGAKKEINIEKIGLVGFVIPPLTRPGAKIKLDCGEENQNCYATIDVIFPDNLSYEEKKLYDKLRILGSSKENDSGNKRDI